MKIEINKGLFLNIVEVPSKTNAKSIVTQPTNHLVIIDCSGSMHSQLPLIRHQLKNKLPSLLKADDTISIVWFSGRDQCGLLAEKVKVSNLNDLNHLNTSIDRWLNPMNLTGFVQPLQQVLKLTNDGGVYSLFFLTDGYDNQWSRQEIIDVTAKLKNVVSSAVFVEYGWNCNRQLMTEMAEEVGGSLVFCENFESYDPVISHTLSRSFRSNKKVSIAVDSPLHDLVFSTGNDAPVTYKVVNGKVTVPEEVSCIYYYSNDKYQETCQSIKDFPACDREIGIICQSLVILSQRMKSKTIKEVLAGLGDVKLFNIYANCFGKQNNTDFQKLCMEASLDNDKRFTDGRKYDIKIDEKAFTILDLLFLLSDDDGNKFVPSAMSYSRIGRLTEEAIDDLTDDEKAEINEMTANAKTTADFDKIQKRMKAIQKSKPDSLIFEYDDTEGFSITNLVWNESRPNVSLQVRYTGTVNLPKNKFGLPKEFPSFLYRNYTIIRDGIANMKELPVKLSHQTFNILRDKYLVGGSYDSTKTYMINLRDLPTINQMMVHNVSAKSLFNLQYALTVFKAAQKVYSAFRDKWFGKRESEGFKKLYGEDATAWLAEIGITDYSGFNPKTRQAEAVDFYMGVEMDISLAGFKSIPSFGEFSKKIASGKALTPREKLLKEAYEECMAHENDSPEKLKEWIAGVEKFVKTSTRAAIRKMAELKFAVIVGQVWFEEFPSINENTLTMDFDGSPVECKVELKDVEIKI